MDVSKEQFPGTSLVKIAVDPSSSSVAKGLTQQFTATGTYSDGSTRNLTTSVTWVSQTTNVATINSSGLATGAGPGTATLMAQMGNVKSAGVLLTTLPVSLVSIALTPSSPSIAKGMTQQFTTTGTYTDGSTQNLSASVTWTTGTPSVAAVNSSGLANSLLAGTAQITATSGSFSAHAILTVTASTLVSIAISPGSASLTAGQSQQFTATGTYSDNSTSNLSPLVSWSSANTSIATINSSGLAKSVGVGTTSIEIGTYNGLSPLNEASITVNDVKPNVSYPPLVCTQGQPCSTSPINSGGAVLSWQPPSSALPQGLNFSTSTGIVSGTPTVISAAQTFTITATNSGGSSTAALVVTVNPPPLATSILNVSVGSLTVLNSNCSSSGYGTIWCNAAIDQYCSKAGYVSGFGPIDFAGTQANIVCLGSSDAVYFSQNSLSAFATTYNVPGCTQGNSFSLSCLAAINQFCTNAGYAGGWGPVEQLGDAFNFFCTRSFSTTSSTLITQNFDALRFYDDAICDTPANVLSPFCISAAHHGCRDLGYLTGYGPLAYNGTNDSNLVVCLGPASAAQRPWLANQVAAMANYNDPNSRVPMNYTNAMSTDPGGVMGSGQAYTRPIASLTFSRISDGSGLTSANINLATGAVTNVKTIYSAPASSNGLLSAAYDPSSLYYYGQYWVAFECYGTLTQDTYSSCMGIYDPSQNAIVPSSVYVLVYGTKTPTPATFNNVPVNVTYSASTPQLLRHRGHIYLYWSTITIGPTVITNGQQTANFLSVQTRGIELKINPANSDRLEPISSSGNFLGAIQSVDAQTVEVFAPPTSRGTAAISDLVSDGVNIYALSEIGTFDGCTSPADYPQNPPLAPLPQGFQWALQCFDTAVSVAANGALGSNTFQTFKVIIPETSQYPHFFALDIESGANDLLGIIGNFPWEPSSNGPSPLKNMKSWNSLIPIPILTSN